MPVAECRRQRNGDEGDQGENQPRVFPFPRALTLEGKHEVPTIAPVATTRRNPNGWFVGIGSDFLAKRAAAGATFGWFGGVEPREFPQKNAEIALAGGAKWY